MSEHEQDGNQTQTIPFESLCYHPIGVIFMGTERDQLLERVIRDPAIQLGRPIIRGTRVPVARIVGALSAGASYAELREDYGLTDEDIRAALGFRSVSGRSRHGWKDS